MHTIEIQPPAPNSWKERFQQNARAVKEAQEPVEICHRAVVFFCAVLTMYCFCAVGYSYYPAGLMAKNVSDYWGHTHLFPNATIPVSVEYLPMHLLSKQKDTSLALLICNSLCFLIAIAFMCKESMNWSKDSTYFLTAGSIAMNIIPMVCGAVCLATVNRLSDYDKSLWNDISPNIITALEEGIPMFYISVIPGAIGLVSVVVMSIMVCVKG